jgi:putative ABC transport system permease protein
MMVSVHQRTRELAMLRAIGAERKHIIGMVLAEAMTLGVLGSIVGVTLGLHEAYSVNAIAANILDVSLRFIVPVGTILAAVGLTLLASLLAGWIPARRAARDSVVAALQTI